MAHNLDIVNGKVAFAYFDRPGWHGLGQSIPEGMNTSEHVIEYANLNHEYIKTPLYTYSGGEFVQVPGYYGSTRVTDGKTVGIVREQYVHLQNREAFSAMDSWLQDGRLRYETAGAIRSGATIFILATLGEDFLIGGVDPVKPYILLTNSHDGTSAVSIKNVMTRVVCANTLTVALKERTAHEVRIRHTNSVRQRVADANRALGLVEKRQKEMFEAFEKLAQLKATVALREQVADIVAPEPGDEDTDRQRKRKLEHREAFFANLVNSPTVKEAGGPDNRWGLFSAATEWLDWVEPRKGQNHLEGRKQLERRMVYTLEGPAAKEREKVFGMLTV